MAEVSFMFMIKYICNNLMKNTARLKLWDMYYESFILSPLFLFYYKSPSCIPGAEQKAGLASDCFGDFSFSKSP